MYTIEKLKENNKIFFKNASFHKDQEYKIVGNKLIVTVGMPYKHEVTYSIDPKTLSLKYYSEN
jgi:hypothetical protein